MNDFVKFRPALAVSSTIGKAPHILARKRARTRLYAALYGPCAFGVPHNNEPWRDVNRGHAAQLTQADFDTMSKAAGFNPVQLDRVTRRFIEIGG